MNLPRVSSAAVLALLLAAVAAPTVLATFAKPASGFTFEVGVWKTATLNVTGVQGCTFDFDTSIANGAILSIDPPSGRGVKKVKLTLTGLFKGSTNFSVSTFNGTCPPATHNYTIDVAPDLKGLDKEFAKFTRNESKDFRFELRAEYKNFGTELKNLNVQYKAGNLDDDQLFTGFHDAAANLSWNVFGKSWMASNAVVEEGSNLLAANGLDMHEASSGLFAGGCGEFDKFQSTVNLELSKFPFTAGKLSKKAIQGFAKLGGPVFTQWTTVPPTYAPGAIDPDHADTPPAQVPLSFLTMTVKPSMGLGADNGRIKVNGTADTSVSGTVDVSLERVQNSVQVFQQTVSANVTHDWFSADFPSLPPGLYKLFASYPGDKNELQLLLSVRLIPEF